ncbi:MAG: cobalt-precorrin-6A reductase [Hyphomicrobiales bacterium]
MPRERILILGGTSDARHLADGLVEQGFDVTTSFAGVTASPLLPLGAHHVGGFGGADGLAAFLRAGGFDRVVDATHPFAAQMSAHAHAACESVKLPLSRLERPTWVAGPGDTWINAATLAEAAKKVPQQARVLLTTGHKGLDGFFAREDLGGLVRVIEDPALALPQGWALVSERPPHRLEGELALLQREAITCVVSKNSGGSGTEAKLEAARQLGLPVVMVRRPAKPPVRSFPDVAAALLGITGKAG